MFICLFVCLYDLFVFFNHSGTPTESSTENFVKIRLNLGEIYEILKNVYLFVCLFLCLYICLFFCFNNSGTPTESSPENFVKIRLDLDEILGLEN